MVTQYEIHPYAKLFPMMQEDEYVTFRSDISTNGLRHPIVLFQGKILDGRNRYRSCCDLDIEPATEEYTGDDALGFVLSLNLYRRQLSVAQRALIAAEVSSLKSADEEASITIEDAATIMGVSPRSISSACKVVRQGVPELLDAVKSGEISISAAERISGLEDQEQKTLCNDGPKAICKAAKQMREKSRPAPKAASKPITAPSLIDAAESNPASLDASTFDTNSASDDLLQPTMKSPSSTELLFALAKEAMEQGYEAETLVGQILDEVEQGLDMQLLLFTSEAMSLLYPRLKAMSFRR
ncbi:hypothetical protein BV581_11305 [Stutzerimonas stutzeri]|uniref:Plasmid replication/partition related protein n=1 Tax=Stutzerimonas stutzeri TaxID=316 RepID=A0A165T022_STUST|nr:MULTISPECIES: ParB/RepB/Spo0J family partition protein [Stutzerimonas stutzeri group]MCH2339006.1 ParB/RepB/Spo0J family partition protein [Pseudomonas sp.]WAD28885.1 ParB/RepB/Spo0J family partition protein [Pseudomonadaceae bacterium T75]KZX56641.1 hypothetical protein A3710_21870 [Stutzerimonas frequens]MBA1265055.1 plasmid replication/partition related protein [Stutzerimonas stutzeri]MBH3355254.1 hypothetical protein [Stutzerimonas stutzeri]